MASQQQIGRAASMARRQQQVNGKGHSVAASAPARQPNGRDWMPTSVTAPAQQAAAQVPATTGFTLSAPVNLPRLKTAPKSASRQRRESLASRGKRADKSSDRQRTNEMAMSRRSAAEAKSAKGTCGCGGPCCQEAKAASTAVAPVVATTAPASSAAVKVKRKPVVNASSSGRMMSRARRAAMAGRGKAGLDSMGKNSTASLARQANPDITTRDLARTVRDSRSKSGARASIAATPTRARRPRNAAEAKAISGTRVGHSEKITGDEAGLCHTGVTGTNYMSAEIFEQFCQTSSPARTPIKVETTETLRGSRVTSAGKVGGSVKLTGIDKGGCREVTGSEYLGREHFAQQCDVTPKASPAKVSQSQTNRGTIISGPRSSRSEKVSGNERGTCQTVTGTPYADSEQFVSYCSTDEQRENRQRTFKSKAGAGKEISGIQPGLVGKRMTGAEAGACQPISGTPYLSTVEVGEVCAASPAKMTDADFPQSISRRPEVGAFSPVSFAPVKEAATTDRKRVTGSGYEDSGSVTGAFSMGKGKVTGTEQSRFGDRSSNVVKRESKADAAAELLSRVTGEGLDTGLRITGDDWNRGERVTGTEGRSAARRNPTRRGGAESMAPISGKREPQRDRPSATVTGGSGGSQGSMVTVSGGARG